MPTTTTTTTSTAATALASGIQAAALGTRDLPPGDPDRAQPLYILIIPGAILLATLSALGLAAAYCCLRRCHGPRLHRAEDRCFPPRYRMPWAGEGR